MKKTKLLGIVFAAALGLVLAACVYDGEFVPGETGAVTLPASVLPNATATFTPGTYTGTAFVTNVGGGQWRGQTPMVVDVTFSANQIVSINLVSHGESRYAPNSYMYRAYPGVADTILVEQSTLGVRFDVEGDRNAANFNAGRDNAINVFTGGTNTQEIIVLAVEDAIRQAGVEPSALNRVNQIENMTAPIMGDRFIPGMQFVYVPAGVYRVADPTALALELIPIDTAWTTDISNATRQEFGVLHNNLRRYFDDNAVALGLATATNVTYPHADTVSAGLARALNATFGYNLEANDPNPLAGNSRGTWIQVSFGRNVFYIGESAGTAGDFFSGLFNGGTGDSAHEGAPQALETVGNNTLGNYWWSQVASRVANDQQSAHGIDAPDVSSNATMSARGLRVALETAMRRAGANPANITPIPHSPFYRAYSYNNDGRTEGVMLVPGFHQVSISESVNLDITLDREVIRVLWIRGASAETVPGWDNANWTAFRNSILFAYAQTFANGGRSIEALAEITPMEGVDVAFSNAVLDAIRGVINNNNLDNVNQAGRLGHFNY
ncbi:MAG: hypothetical protein FWE33_00970 [Defluviitaleaceae bacterium]|jgi:uncharacterized protein with FMN-binding domain|nr:hypothetical protein [Defluviitaleaceae bacterium]